MKRMTAVLFAVLTIACALESFGQDQNRLGFGISLNPSRIQQVAYDYYYYYGGGMYVESNIPVQTPISFYVPIHVNERFRLEPAFGFSSSGNETVTSSTNPTSRPVTGIRNYSSVFVGLSGYYVIPHSPSFDVYIGPRLGVSFLSTEYENSDFYGGTNPVKFRSETKETDFVIGAACGAEFFPVSQLSVGGEFQFNYTSFGNPDMTQTYTPPQTSIYTTKYERKRHLWSTDVLFFLRWYFLQN
ncbi:MAG: outer membrane beta-barrel protein [Ignavibacteriae bacterium]|nr:outer membrane beta-barrel protein [Ignavibacteriota bacterium]